MALNPNSFGAIGERVGRDWLKKNGYHILNASAIENGGAPLLESTIVDIISPDILAAIGGGSLWVDVKTKRRTTRNAKRNRFETGCAMRHFLAYKEVARVTGIPGALLFIHLEEKTLDFATLEWLESDMAIWTIPSSWTAGHAFSESMAFFNLDRFDRYALDENGSMKELRAASVPAKNVRVWEKRKPPAYRQGMLFSL